MDPLKKHFKVRSIWFIDEYRLLCIVEWRDLVLWDFTVDGDPGRITFKVGRINDVVSRLRRNYELFDTQPFRVDPEGGIVALRVSNDTSADSYVLVIPTEVFVGWKLSRKRGLLGKLWDKIPNGGTILWSNWKHFVTKINTHSFSSFHTHVLCTRAEKVNRDLTRVSLFVYDFSLYSRREEQNKKEQEWPTEVEAYGTRSLPPVVVHRQELNLDTSVIPYDDHKLLPTENGVLVIKVRIPVVARRIEF